MQILFPFPVKDPPLYYVPDTRYKLRITKTSEVTPRRFSLFLSRASLREFSFLALSRDIIPLDCIRFRGIIFRFSFSFFQGNSIARLVCPFPRDCIPLILCDCPLSLYLTVCPVME